VDDEAPTGAHLKAAESVVGHTSGLAAGDLVIFRPEIIEFGGEERVILALARRLRALRIPVAVACYYDAIGLAKYADFPIRVHLLSPKRNPLSKILALRRMLRWLYQTQSPTPILFSIQSAYHAGLARSAHYHLWIPDTYSLLGAPNYPRSLIARLKDLMGNIPRRYGTSVGVRCAAKFITNSRALQQEMQAHYRRSADVLYLGGAGEPLAVAPLRTPTTLQLLSVCRLQESKRIEWALSALAQKSEYALWNLHIVGRGPEAERLAEMAKALGIDDRVMFHGFLPDAALEDLYRRAHIFLIPARQGYGLPALEAIYRRVGVVISDESGVVEILQNTPWVAIGNGGEEGFAVALRSMIQRVADPAFFENPLPVLPTEESWADEVVQLCGWHAAKRCF
jgi:glycosyltransferase involved in cell wall biosynthesis